MRIVRPARMLLMRLLRNLLIPNLRGDYIAGIATLILIITTLPNISKGFVNRMRPIHYGSFGGLPTKIFAFIGGLAPHYRPYRLVAAYPEAKESC